MYLCMTWKSSWACTAVAFVTEATMVGFGKNRVLYLLQKGNFKNAKKMALTTHTPSLKKNDSITSKRPKWQFSSGLTALLTTDYHIMASSGMIKLLRPNGIDPQKVAQAVGVHIAPWLRIYIQIYTNIIICEYIIMYIYNI